MLDAVMGSFGQGRKPAMTVTASTATVVFQTVNRPVVAMGSCGGTWHRRKRVTRLVMMGILMGAMVAVRLA
jgi:hypothetical protein